MDNNMMKLMMKMFGILTIVFCGIALIVPWAGLGIMGFGVGVYPWGILSDAAFMTSGQSDFFFIQTMQTGVAEAIVFAICMIITFVLTIIALILSIRSIMSVNMNIANSFLKIGIISIIAIILCVIGVFSANSAFTSNIGIGFGYSWGFYLMIFAIIISFVFKILLIRPMWHQVHSARILRKFSLQRKFASVPFSPVPSYTRRIRR